MQLRQTPRDQKGQASVMIGIMMMTFMLFFAFVINIGMLVNAKINLQNAADLAAYAGAAVQARQLNHISYLNYEMRRQYKKFLFRYYVMGNMAQKGFPSTGPAPKKPHFWSPDGIQPYGVPAVCVIFNNNDNYCQLKALPQISIPPVNPLDSISSTLGEQLKQIEGIRKKNCFKIGRTNTTLLTLWLFNADPTLKNVTADNTDPELRESITIIKGLAAGIGLLPRELILQFRIKTLSDYINFGAQKGLTRETVEAFKQTPDPAKRERSIQAFLSAFFTLGNNTFDGSSIAMDELLPSGGGDQAALIKLNENKIKFDTYAIDFTDDGGSGGNPDSATGNDCSPTVRPIKVTEPVPIGFVKDESRLTYYAIRLRAKAKVMFSPFGDMELSAFSAAQPFGSRISPLIVGDDSPEFLHREVKLDQSLEPKDALQSLNLFRQIPNLKVFEDDSTGAGGGWDSEAVLSSMFQMFKVPGSPAGTGTNTILQVDMERAYQAAMAPNPYESGKYNIINDLNDDKFVRNFDSQGLAAFWAPVFSPEDTDTNSKIKAKLQDLAGDNPDPIVKSLLDTLLVNMSTYVTQLKTGQGENLGGNAFEGLTIAQLQDPFSTRPEGGASNSGVKPLEIPGEPSPLLNDPAQVKTSWNDVNEAEAKKTGRVGYSVKFVSFDSLLNRKILPRGSGGNSMANPPDDDAIVPLNGAIKH